MNKRLQKIEQLCRKYRVKTLYVFGGRSAEIFHAIEDDTPAIQSSQSDIDIGVLTYYAFPITDKVGLALELEEVFDVPRVDLAILQEADAFLAANIIRGERIFAEDSYLADEYELFVLRRAGDLAELERERMAMILAGGITMLPGKISKRVVTDRMAWVVRMLSEIRALPLESKTVFMQDSRNIWAAESCLRRALEALFDMGRHIAAKGYGEAVTEYKEIAAALKRHDVVSADEFKLMQKLAGYRNRLVHFYHDVSADELYEICASHLGDVETVANSLRLWLADRSELLDETL